MQVGIFPPVILQRAPRLLGALLSVFVFLTSASCERKKEGTPPWEPTVKPAAAATGQLPEQPAQPKLANPAKATPSGEGFRFITYNVENWLTMDRYVERKSLKSAPKPEKEKLAVVNLLARHKPDIIGLCEIGTAADLAEIQERLKEAGLVLPHSHYTGGADPVRHLGLLSRYPIIATAKPSEMQFQLEGKTFAIGRGILDATVDVHGKSYRFIGAHLKSKRETDLGDQEIIRLNEARLLRRHIDRILATDENQRVVLYGDLNDTRATRAIKTLTGSYNDPAYLTAIPAKDSKQHAWTHHWAPHDIYSRIDFVMVNRPMRKEVDFKASKIIDDKDWDQASDHRPVLAIFR
jgi:endonuclease/exonuclease/phosphatase family metal-dependent hydrolase